jgi:subtilisin family serine protease
MLRLTAAAAVVLISTAATAQPEVQVMSTLCQAESVNVLPDVNDRRLIGCGEGFPDNLLWNLDRSDSAMGDLDQTVKRKLTGRGAVVYVLDFGGVMQAHDEFARATGPNVIAGLGIPACLLQPCELTFIEWAIGGHGTGVASVVAGLRTGVAPDAKIVAVRPDSSSDADWARALDLIVGHAWDPLTPPFRTAIVTMSSAPGFGRQFPQFEERLRRMIGGVDANGNADPNGKRFLFTILGGNLGSLLGSRLGHCTNPDGLVDIFPAIIGPEVDGLITVGGLGRDEHEWAGACKGPAIEVLAPAEAILVASNSGHDLYRFEPAYYISGTSYATPYVAGMAARLLELDPTLTPQELESRIKSSPSRVGDKPMPVILVAPKRRAVR